MDAHLEVEQRQKHIDQSVKDLITYGKERARADQQYKIQLTKKILLLKEQGAQAVLIKSIAQGTADIADIALRRDIQGVLYEAAQESIMNDKQRIKTLNEMISREWGNTR